MTRCYYVYLSFFSSSLVIIILNIDEQWYEKNYYHINCGVIQGFLALREAVTCKISYFFTCVDIANQLLTRHSPLAPLGQVDE